MAGIILRCLLLSLSMRSLRALRYVEVENGSITMDSESTHEDSNEANMALDSLSTEQESHRSKSNTTSVQLNERSTSDLSNLNATDVRLHDQSVSDLAKLNETDSQVHDQSASEISKANLVSELSKLNETNALVNAQLTSDLGGYLGSLSENQLAKASTADAPVSAELEQAAPGQPEVALGQQLEVDTGSQAETTEGEASQEPVLAEAREQAKMVGATTKQSQVNTKGGDQLQSLMAKYNLQLGRHRNPLHEIIWLLFLGACGALVGALILGTAFTARYPCGREEKGSQPKGSFLRNDYLTSSNKGTFLSKDISSSNSSSNKGNVVSKPAPKTVSKSSSTPSLVSNTK